MTEPIPLTEKYERNGWPAIVRPDLQPPLNWSLELVASLNLIHHHSLSPDGSEVAFVWQRDGRSDIWVQSLTGGWPRRVVMRTAVIDWLDTPPQWSPNGNWLAYTDSSHVFVVPAAGGALPQKISDFTSAAWGPVWVDNERLVVQTERYDADQLWLVDRNGRFLHEITRQRDGDCGQTAVSPAGQQLVYVLWPFADLRRLELHLVNLDGSNDAIIASLPAVRDWSPRWSPDGQQIAFLSQRSGYDQIWLLTLATGDLRPLTALTNDIGEFHWLPHGQQLLATVNREGYFYPVLVAVATGELTELVQEAGVFYGACVGENGRFATIHHADSVTPPDIYRLDLATGEKRPLTHSCPPVLQAMTLIQPEIVRYPSYDGLEIPALLYRPLQPNGAALVHLHGGPSGQSLPAWDITLQYYLAKGYTLLVPNYRGSTGYGVAFERANYNDWGVGDTQDVLHGAKFLHQLPAVDRSRIGVWGASYGGYLTVTSLARDPDYLFACGFNKFGDANVYSSWAQCNRFIRQYTEMMIGHPRTAWAHYLAASPIHEVANITKPLLIVHGLTDDIVPPQASEELVAALQAHDKPYEYKTYAKEPHGFLNHANDLDWRRRMAQFFDWHLRG